MKILMVVTHGETQHAIARGGTFEECLAYLSANPLYKGYGPRLTDMTPLKETGKLSIGWADYTFFPEDYLSLPDV